MKRSWIILLMLLVGCSNGDDSAKERTGTPVHAKIITVAVKNVPQTYSTMALIGSEQKISISSRLSGFISEIPVREGERVTKGQLLLRVDPVDVRQDLAQARADYANAKADLERFTALLKEHAVTRQQYDRVKLRHDMAKAKLVQAKNQLNYAEIRAPVDGIIVRKLKNSGDLAAPGSPILVLENIHELNVTTYVSERFIKDIHEGDMATVRVDHDAVPLPARIRQVVQAADENSHQFLVKLVVPEHDFLRPGLSVEVSFQLGKRKAVVLPLQAIVQRQGLSGVYVVDENGTAHWRIVRPGQVLDKNHIEIAAGLKGGERIVAGSAPGLYSGAKVSL